MPKNLRPVSRALLSVSDKTGVLEFAQALDAQGVALLSTGGTAKLLRDAGLKVTEIGDYTGFPEMLDGRVKTLHPKVHGGILARRDLPAHMATIEQHSIPMIDLVCVNLYPFRETVAKAGVTLEDAIENEQKRTKMLFSSRHSSGQKNQSFCELHSSNESIKLNKKTVTDSTSKPVLKNQEEMAKT